MRQNSQKPPLQGGLPEFDKLPDKTKELMILGDHEEHAIGVKKAALQKTIQRRVIKSQKTK
jgi:hypothetical protein